MTQEQALNILTLGENVFLTGEPGSGKTYTIRKYINWLRKHGVIPAVTASTGIAATHVSGMTIHSWSGIGIRDHATDGDIARIAENSKVKKRVEKTNVLIIDEVSMLPAHVLSLVERVCRQVRGGGEMFGGIQVVLVGDFFQLPPIVRRESYAFAQSAHSIELSGPGFVYSSPLWQQLNLKVCYLDEQHRQSDLEFLSILSAIRGGTVDELHIELLSSRKVSGIHTLTTKLFPHNADVDKINTAELDKLPGKIKRFEMHSAGPTPVVEQLQKSCLSPVLLDLKLGSWVMFTKNSPEGKYVNGTLGSVVGFEDKTNLPLVETKSGRLVTVEPEEWRLEDGEKVLGKITQLPLRLAWAITVHKSQGMSLDSVHVDLRNAFEYGQGYVALSRVRTLAGLSLAGFNQRALEVHPEVVTADVGFKRESLLAERFIDSLSLDQLAKQQGVFLSRAGGEIEEMDGGPTGALEQKIDTYTHTLELLKNGMGFLEIAAARQVKPGTIVAHIEWLLEKNMLTVTDLRHVRLSDVVVYNTIRKAFTQHGTDKLKPVFESLEGGIDYDTLKLARVFHLLDSTNTEN